MPWAARVSGRQRDRAAGLAGFLRGANPLRWQRDKRAELPATQALLKPLVAELRARARDRSVLVTSFACGAPEGRLVPTVTPGIVRRRNPCSLETGLQGTVPA